MARPRPPHSGGNLGAWGRGPDSGGATFGQHMDRETLDLLEGGEIRPPAEASPSTAQQLKYLTDRKGGPEAMRSAGIPDRTRRGWKSGRTPGAKNRERLADAYWRLRATNWRRTGRTPSPAVRTSLAPQLQERAHGRRMTITPVDSRDVAPQAQGAQSKARERTMRPSDHSWDRLVDSWANDDETALDTAWMDFASEIESPPELYYEVGDVSFML